MRYIVDNISKTVEFQDEYNPLEIAKVMEIYAGYKFTTKLNFPMIDLMEQQNLTKGIQRGNDYQPIQGSSKQC